MTSTAVSRPGHRSVSLPSSSDPLSGAAAEARDTSSRRSGRWLTEIAALNPLKTIPLDSLLYVLPG